MPVSEDFLRRTRGRLRETRIPDADPRRRYGVDDNGTDRSGTGTWAPVDLWFSVRETRGPISLRKPFIVVRPYRVPFYSFGRPPPCRRYFGGEIAKKRPAPGGRRFSDTPGGPRETIYPPCRYRGALTFELIWVATGSLETVVRSVRRKM